MSDERILEVEVREQSSDHICPHFEGMSVNVFDLKWMSPKNQVQVIFAPILKECPLMFLI